VNPNLTAVNIPRPIKMVALIAIITIEVGKGLTALWRISVQWI